MKKTLLWTVFSSAAIAGGLLSTTAFAQARPDAARAAGGAGAPGGGGAEEMARKFGGGGLKSGVNSDGPEVDKHSIAAPVVQPGYKVPRLSDGRPNLTGTWSNASNTALSRPTTMKNLVMTDAEELLARQNNPQNIRQA